MISSPASAAIAFLTGTPGRLLAVLIVAGGLVLGAEIWLARRDAASYARGHRDAVAEWTADTNRRQALALAVTARYRATEQGLAASVAAVADHYQGVNRNAQRENDRLRADLRDGRVRLYAEVVELCSLIDKVRRYRLQQRKAPFECVCVESDWPEYEYVWAMIESRVRREAK